MFQILAGHLGFVLEAEFVSDWLVYNFVPDQGWSSAIEKRDLLDFVLTAWRLSIMALKPKRRSDLITRDLEDEVVILNHATGMVHQLNPTAGYIWACCDGEISTGEIIDRLMRDFGVLPEVANTDVIRAIDQFGKLGLLED